MDREMSSIYAGNNTATVPDQKLQQTDIEFVENSASAVKFDPAESYTHLLHPSNQKLADQLRNAKFAKDDFWQEGEKHKILVYYGVNSISDVDILKNTFEAEIFVRLAWKAHENNVRAALQTRSSTINEALLEFMPTENWTFFNSKECQMKRPWKPLLLSYFGSDSKQITHGFHFQTNTTFSVSFKEIFELQRFPVDCQDLTICMGLTTDKYASGYDKIELHPLSNGLEVAVVMLKGIEETDFKYRHFINEFQITDPRADGIRWSFVNCRIKIQRSWESYFWRICLVLSLVTLCGCVGFSFDMEEDFPDACSFMSTILLTVVAFFFVVSASVPAIPYLTFLDQFVYTLLVFTTAQMGSLVLFDFGLLEGKERTVFWTSIGIWIVIHISFLIAAIIKYKNEAVKLTLYGLEYDKCFERDRSSMITHVSMGEHVVYNGGSTRE